MLDRNYVRHLLSELNITTENVSIEQLKDLRWRLAQELKNSGIYDGSAEVNHGSNLKFITMRTNRWEAREAVSFNRDGFIGFAGWADNENVQPILRATAQWASDVKESE